MTFIQDLKTVIKEAVRSFRLLRWKRQRVRQITLPF